MARSFFGPFLSRSKEGRDALSGLFQQFARLTARFVALDVMMLPRYIASGNSIVAPHIASKEYLRAFTWLLRKEENPHIGRNLETHYRWNWNDDVCLMLNNFFMGGASIDTLTSLTEHLLLLIPRYPKLVESLTDPGRLVYRAVTDAAQGLSESEGAHPFNRETYQQVISQGYQYYNIMAPGLSFIIEKHITCLNPDSAMVHILGLTHVFYCSLTFEPHPARDILDEHRKINFSLPQIYSSQIISNEWKFEMLRKLIVSSQMQLRVTGVTSMCSDLLNLFTKNRKDDPTTHPLLLYFANLILRDKLVDYIVGIGSHPEIISESYNIVGFLIATKTYTPQQTDTVWRTVMTSQDPRVVEAILRMLGNIINLHDYDSLLYLCKKVGELPVESFTVSMREYTDRLLKHVVERKQPYDDVIDAPPYELCIRLIRESSIPRQDAPAGLLDIQTWAGQQLRGLMPHGPGSVVRNSIYVSCIEDISKRTATAAGSICALFGLLRTNLVGDLHILTTENGLTRLMVEDLEANNASERDAVFSSTANTPARLARRELLLAIVNYEPSTISPELGERLWNLLVGEEAKGGLEREVGWQILNSAAKKSGSRNVFIATCFREHLPNLDPTCYTLGSLDFAREAISAWMNEAQGDFLDETQHPTNGAIEQLWRMVLKAPLNSIEAPAVNFMVELYVESMTILRMPRSRAHSVHLALVTRCLNQLSSAASKLKTFSDGTNSGDDEPMVIVVSENQVQEQELIFTRSLILLREFLRLLQSNGHFATPKPRSPIVNVSSEVTGEILTIKYQTFDGNETGDIKSLIIGSQNNVAALFISVRNATGFKNCKIYHWGKELNIDDTDLHTPLSAMKVGKGLLLIMRRDGDEISEERLRVKSSTIEYEIIQHSDELWEYLGMEEKLAREIYYFLIKFPVYGKLLAAFEDEQTSCTDVFPLGQPFKCLYAIYAIREYLTTQFRDGVVNTVTRSRAIGLVVAAINTNVVVDSCPSEEMRFFVALHLTECLTHLLREPISADFLTGYLDKELLDRLLQLLYSAKVRPDVPNSVQLVASAFEVILEICFHSPNFWLEFKSKPSTPRLFVELLLEEPRTGLRKSIMKQISIRSSWVSSLCTLSAVDFSMALWPILNDAISQAVKIPHKCEETLSLALQIFRKLADTSIESVNIEECLLRWGNLLVEHSSMENVGHPENLDLVARWLSNLLYWCASFAKASRSTVPPNTLATQLLSKHLFTPYASDLPEIETDDTAAKLPVLNTMTRKFISDTIIYLTKDDEVQYRRVMEHLDALLPYNNNDESMYTLAIIVDYTNLV
jgi:ubiquitin carboxyl-terminal hydrolase 34